ncbi:hypothetical protein [Sporosarcina globispora]|uniref:hypothetical protein n=1 Tax=Sporosarcina globispora TaxID=1459 RepID=UPI0013792122|nr:hypothetical protein [Sporosarcina globispora]
MKRIKSTVNHHIEKKSKLNPDSLMNYIEQLEFDYDMEKAYRPEVLMKENDNE